MAKPQTNNPGHMRRVNGVMRRCYYEPSGSLTSRGGREYYVVAGEKVYVSYTSVATVPKTINHLAGEMFVGSDGTVYDNE